MIMCARRDCLIEPFLRGGYGITDVVLVSMIILTCQPYDEEMTSAAIIEDVKRKLEAKEMEKRQANSDTWNKLDNYQEQMLLRRWVYGTPMLLLSRPCMGFQGPCRMGGQRVRSHWYFSGVWVYLRIYGAESGRLQNSISCRSPVALARIERG